MKFSFLLFFFEFLFTNLYLIFVQHQFSPIPQVAVFLSTLPLKNKFRWRSGAGEIIQWSLHQRCYFGGTTTHSPSTANPSTGTSTACSSTFFSSITPRIRYSALGTSFQTKYALVAKFRITAFYSIPCVHTFGKYIL